MARVSAGDSRLRTRRLRRRVLMVGAACTLVFALVGALALLSWASFIRITSVKVSGVRAIEAATLEQTVWQDMAGGYAYLFARSNIFLYPRQAIAADLTANFSTIKSVDVHAEDFHTLDVVVVERQPTALWCGEVAASSTPCYFLDEDGLAYAPAAAYSGDAYQKYYGPLLQATTTDEVAHGQFLTPQHFRTLPALVESLRKAANTGEVASVFVDQAGDVHVAFANGFVLLFADTDDGGGVVEHFSLALSAAPFTAHPLADFEYLDLRFGDKVYYKLKGK